MAPGRHKGWHSRGYLPHLDAGELTQSVTFRLADSLPRKVVDSWKRELGLIDGLDEEGRSLELRKRISRYEDAGHGDCVLRDAECASTVQSTLKFFHGERYELLEWCVMPNHVHVIVRLFQGSPLGKVIKSWKTYSAKEINKLTERQGSLWAVDYHDRYIRDEDHFNHARRYVRNNPVKAGLCARPEDWEWGSAWATSGRG